MAYLVFDIGSSAVKAALISEKGVLLSLARSPVSLVHGSDGSHVTDAAACLIAARAAGREAVSEADSGRSVPVRAIAVSGNGPTLVPVGSDGSPIGPALSWLDRRAVGESIEISDLSEIPVDPSFYLPKALRLWRGTEEFRLRLRWFFSLPEYLLFDLCGEALTYLPHPGYLPYIWDDSLIGALGLPSERFPPFAAPGTRAGGLRPDSASALGLEPGIPVIAGFPDFLASIVGSGAIEVGIACDRSGASEALNICADRPFPGRDLLSLPHAIEGLWNISGGVSTSGAALDWLASVLGVDRAAGSPETDAGYSDAPGAALIDCAAHSPPGARGLVFLPYLAGERAPLWDAGRRGAFVGLSLSQGRADLARAACESIVFGLRLAAELAEGAGFALAMVRASGEAASREFLCALKADTLGVPVELPSIPDCELVGDACACACALGDASGIAEASRSLVRITRQIAPDPASSAPLTEAYESFRTALAALASVDARARRRASDPR